MKYLIFIGLLTFGIGVAADADEAKEISAQDSFDAFWALFDEHYALFDAKRIQWDRLYDVYRPRVTKDTSREELFNIFTAVIDTFNDIHVTVRDEKAGRFQRSGARSIGKGDFDNGEFSIDLISTKYTVGGLSARAGGTFRFGWLKDDIGYIHLNAFKYPTSTGQAIDEAMIRFASARAIIIDVRQNGGGDDTVGKLVADHFAQAKAKYMSVAGRVPGPDHRAFRPSVDWFIEPADGPNFKGEVITLTNSRTISAAENFVLAMRAIPQNTILGDVTAGAMADTISVAVDGGWRFSVPINVFRDAKGVCWEGVGLTPDYWMVNQQEDILAGRDRVLELAIDFVGAR